MDILRFLTAGSVDDGKSTLIGRLLYDSKNILADQLEAIERRTKNKANGEVDLALLTDGLRAEREQGITIDVAYKYFSTPKRKFIIADAPGHIQYTRNMITGASNADLIIILVDARNGIIEQTKRHSIIASLLNIPNVVVAVNKMDLVHYSEDRFTEIVSEYHKIAEALSLKSVKFIPISAKDGDNVVDKSDKMTWYSGEPLLVYLETVELGKSINYENSRFPVQLILRPQVDEFHDYRGYAGKVASGIFRVNDKVKIYPSNIETTIKEIEVGNQQVEECFAPQSAVIHLEDDIDISRGDLIAKKDDLLRVGQDIEALICWMDEKPLTLGTRYLLQHNSKIVVTMVNEIRYRLDVNTLEKEPNPSKAELNEIVEVLLKTSALLSYDAYQNIRENGSAILIDETSFVTVGAVLLK